MGVTYEEALATLTSMFGSDGVWTTDVLDEVLRAYEGRKNFSGACCHQCILCEVMYIVFSTNFVWYVTFVGRAYGEYG